jgi:hypothetical protein
MLNVDCQTIHADDMGVVVGEFYGEPVIEWFPANSLRREDSDTRRRVQYSKAIAEGNVALPN